MLDSVIKTGRTASDGLSRLRRYGAKPIALAVIFDWDTYPALRQDNLTKLKNDGIKIYSLLSYSQMSKIVSQKIRRIKRKQYL